MTPSNYNFTDQYFGDTFDGVTFELKYLNTEEPIDLTGCTINMEFRYGKDGALLQRRLSTQTGEIIIEDEVNGIVKMNNFMVDWPPRVYIYDMEFVYPNGEVKTYLKGSMKVYPDITQNND